MDLSSNSVNEYIPIDCAYYRFLIVEELVLQRQFEELHVGKCCVIGKLALNSIGYFELESLRLPNLPSDYMRPEGTFSVRLLDYDLIKGNIPLRSGRYSEACGEVVLITKSCAKTIKKDLLTTYELHTKLRQLETDEEKASYLEYLQETHCVAIKLHSANEIDRASELVERNLSLRQFYPEIW